MTSITPINISSVHNITSGQVITALENVVKELVENALDAQATTIEVRFKNYGLDGVEVTDNGAGIAKDDFPYIDLDNVETYGFRGEALSSLCALSRVIITTATAKEAPKGSRLMFNNTGEIADSVIVPTKVGTTVLVEDLFIKLPVRRSEFERNDRKEYGKSLHLLQAYASISTGVKFLVTNTVAKRYKEIPPSVLNDRKVIQIATKGNANIRENLTNVFGSRILQTLVPIASEKYLPAGSLRSRDKVIFKLEGFISNPQLIGGRKAVERHLLFVNRRPVLLPRWRRVVNEVYRSHSSSQCAFHCLNITLSSAAFDVNVTPDKRTVLVHFEDTAIEAFRSCLEEALQEATVMTQGALTRSETLSDDEETLDIHYTSSLDVRPSGDLEESSVRRNVPPLSTFSDDLINENSNTLAPSGNDNVPAPPTEPTIGNQPSRIRNTAPPTFSAMSPSLTSSWMHVESPVNRAATRKHRKIDDFFENLSQSSLRARRPREDASGAIHEGISSANAGSADGSDPTQDDKLPEAPTEEKIFNDEARVTHLLAEAERSIVDRDAAKQRAIENFNAGYSLSLGQTVTVASNIDAIRSLAQRMRSTRLLRTPDTALDKNVIAYQTDDIAVEERLSLSVKRKDFERMRIIGQFNKGFILASRAIADGKKDDIFIIDQHASDEKYNFERLQRDTIIQSQPLVWYVNDFDLLKESPQPLELTVVEELLVAEYETVLKKNGFEVAIDPESNKCVLKALPISKQTVFDIGDLMELVHELQEATGTDVRCSKASRMFASRACRSSVMVGKTLAIKDMRRIVSNLGTLTQPWVCRAVRRY